MGDPSENQSRDLPPGTSANSINTINKTENAEGRKSGQSVVEKKSEQSVVAGAQSGQSVVADAKSGQSVVADAKSERSVIETKSEQSVVADAKSGQSVVADAKSGQSVVADAKSGQSVVADAKSGQSVVADAKSRQSVISDAKSGQSVVADAKSRKSVISEAKSGQSVVTDAKSAKSGQSVVTDAKSEQSVVADAKSRQSVVETENIEIRESVQSSMISTALTENTSFPDETQSEIAVSENEQSIQGSIRTGRSSVSQSEIMSASIAGSIRSVRTTDSFNRRTSRLKRRKGSHEPRHLKSVSQSQEPTIQTIPKNHPLEGESDTTVVTTVEQLKKNTKCLAMENTVFIHFLQKNDPSLLEGLEVVVSSAQQKSQRSSVTLSRKLTLTRYSRRESNLLWNPPSISTLLSTGTHISLDREGPKINLTQKTDLVLREMEEIKTLAEAVEKKYYILRHKLVAQLEEMNVRESELRQTLETFENVFIYGTVEKYTQSTNPAEKFCRFLEEWFKKSRLTVDKIRLRTSSLRVQYQKICVQLAQKQLLGENLEEVDFEQLHIENKNLRKTIEQRNLLLLEMKKMHGKANLALSVLKKLLIKKSNDLRQVQQDIQDKEEKIIKFDEECERVSVELDNMKSAYDQIKLKTETYQVPQILEYVKAKAEVDVLKKNLKIWMRRKQLKEVSLNSCIREMMQATGIETPQPHWFTDPRLNISLRGRGSLDSTFEFDFQRLETPSIMSNPKKRIFKKKS